MTIINNISEIAELFSMIAISLTATWLTAVVILPTAIRTVRNAGRLVEHHYSRIAADRYARNYNRTH